MEYKKLEHGTLLFKVTKELEIKYKDLAYLSENLTDRIVPKQLKLYPELSKEFKSDIERITYDFVKEIRIEFKNEIAKKKQQFKEL